MTMTMSERELRHLSRLPLPIPPSPWPATTRPGRHYAALNKAHLPARLKTKLVGLSFSASYPGNVDNLERLLAELGPAVPCRLVREPDNPYDACAVRVDWINGDGEPDEVGHVPGALAARLAPEIDAGHDWRIVDVEVLRKAGQYATRPGVGIGLERF